MPPASILQHLTAPIASGGLDIYPVWLLQRYFPRWSVACNSDGYDIWGPNGIYHHDHSRGRAR